jgi:tRNA threonylcarbamoyl adenosine modification protein YeaZ
VKAYSTGLELVLNAAEGLLQIVVTDNEVPLCVQEWNLPRRSTEILAPALREICAALGIKAGDFRRVACVHGPGSFTGIRLVLTTAAALRRAGRARLAGLNYLQSLAATVAVNRRLPFEARIAVVTHARRDLVHFCPFVSLGPEIPPWPLHETRLLTPREALADALSLWRGRLPVYMCGSGLARNAFVFEACGERIVLAPECANPVAAALRIQARHGEYFDGDIEPAYLRPCDAVENLPHFAAQRGEDGGEAVARLEDMLARPPKSERASPSSKHFKVKMP